MLVVTLLVLYFTDIIEAFSRAFFALTFLLHVVVGYELRLAWKWVVRNYVNPGLQKRVIMALLDPETADQAMARINHDFEKNYEIGGIILTGQDDRYEIGGVPVMAHVDDAADTISPLLVDAIYIDCEITEPSTVEFMNACVRMGIPFHYHIPPVFGEGNKYSVEHFGREYVLTSSLNFVTPAQQMFKRLMDIAGGLVGSIIALFIILIVGPKIKKASPGPILFAQERIGLNGRRFKLYKLRSMCMDAEQKKQALMDQNRIDDGLMFKLMYFTC